MKLQAYACESYEKLKPRGNALKGAMGKQKKISNRKSNLNTDSATSNTVNYTDTLCGIVRVI